MSQDRLSLRTHRDAVMQKGITFVRRARRFGKWINVICVLGGGALAAIGGSFEGGLFPSSGDGFLTFKGFAVLLGVAGVTIGGIVLLLLQDEAPEILARAAALEGEAQRFLDERDSLVSRLTDFTELDQRRLALISANASMREALEQALLVPAANVEGSAMAMLEVAKRMILASIDFKIDEQWAISVFRVVDDRLERIAAIRADQLQPPQEARTWKKNEGFVGQAWSSEKHVIVEDGTLPHVLDQFDVPHDLRRPYDAERYRSMAAIPIRLGDPVEIWGVVAASTNYPGRFRRDPGNKQTQSVDTVRLIARMTGLAAAAFRRSEQ